MLRDCGGMFRYPNLPPEIPRLQTSIIQYIIYWIRRETSSPRAFFLSSPCNICKLHHTILKCIVYTLHIVQSIVFKFIYKLRYSYDILTSCGNRRSYSRHTDKTTLQGSLWKTSFSDGLDLWNFEEYKLLIKG